MCFQLRGQNCFTNREVHFLKNKDFQESKTMGHSGSVLTGDFDSGVRLIPGSPSLSLRGASGPPLLGRPEEGLGGLAAGEDTEPWAPRERPGGLGLGRGGWRRFMWEAAFELSLRWCGLFLTRRRKKEPLGAAWWRKWNAQLSGAQSL